VAGAACSGYIVRVTRPCGRADSIVAGVPKLEGATMRWKLVCTLAAVLAFVGMAMADTFTAIITEVKDGKVTFYKGSFNKEEKKFEKSDTATTLPVSSDVKVAKSKFDKEAKKVVAGDAIEGGVKNEMFNKIPEKGMFATITTDSDNKKITEILVGGFGKKKKQ
jgi:hypothetical protein